MGPKIGNLNINSCTDPILAKKNFSNIAEKNKFYEKLGISFKPEQEDKLADLNEKNK